MRRYRALSRRLAVFSACRSWADCTTIMSGFDFRQGQPLRAINVRLLGNNVRHMLALSLTGFDPERTWAAQINGHQTARSGARGQVRERPCPLDERMATLTFARHKKGPAPAEAQ